MLSRPLAPIQRWVRLPDGVAARMARIPQRDTAPELAVRRAVHALGLRYFGAPSARTRVCQIDVRRYVVASCNRFVDCMRKQW